MYARVIDNNDGLSIIIIIGTLGLLQKHPELLDDTVTQVESTRLCRKNIGTKKLRKWSRGHQFVVRGGGHIDTFQPLYRLACMYLS